MRNGRAYTLTAFSALWNKYADICRRHRRRHDCAGLAPLHRPFQRRSRPPRPTVDAQQRGQPDRVELHQPEPFWGGRRRRRRVTLLLPLLVLLVALLAARRRHVRQRHGRHVRRRWLRRVRRRHVRRRDGRHVRRRWDGRLPGHAWRPQQPEPDAVVEPEHRGHLPDHGEHRGRVRRVRPDVGECLYDDAFFLFR
jgi:hypothetical protein